VENAVFCLRCESISLWLHRWKLRSRSGSVPSAPRARPTLAKLMWSSSMAVNFQNNMPQATSRTYHGLGFSAERTRERQRATRALSRNRLLVVTLLLSSIPYNDFDSCPYQPPLHRGNASEKNRQKLIPSWGRRRNHSRQNKNK
jgi:hypothetical protein